MTGSLRIADCPAGAVGGQIGLTLAPGKKQKGGLSGDHDRDLGADLDVVAAWNAAAVATLMNDDELCRFRIDEIGEEVHARFMEWHHLPIRDGGSQRGLRGGMATGLRLLVGAGNRVLVHCRGGLGRAGMISARLLVEMGSEADAAIAAVRRARGPDAIENKAQETRVR